MHSLIVDYPKPDHIDGNGLNNQRSNLRPATASQNCINRRTWGRSAYRGVSWFKLYSKWNAAISYQRKSRNLGYFASEEDAARAYDAAARELHGAFARLNFPDAA
jgi:AP2 domain